MALFLKSAFRHGMRQKGYTALNILGLAVGLSLFSLIGLYINFEFSVDRFHPNFGRLYRAELNYDGKGQIIAYSNPPLGPILARDFPEIQGYTRFIGMDSPELAVSEDVRFQEDQGFLADDHFFGLFGFRLMQGDPLAVLAEPFSIVLSKELAAKYFPGENAVGRTLRMNGQYDLKVTGVVQDCPRNSHIQYRFLISYSSYKTLVAPDYFENWRYIANFTYLLLAENADVQALAAKLEPVLDTYWGIPMHVPLLINPISRIHFHSRALGGLGQDGDLNRIAMLAAIGFFILVLAGINFVNLSTARAGTRAKEIGIRKTAGADRAILIRQFLGESVLLSFCGFLFGSVLSLLLIHEFGNLVDRELTFWSMHGLMLLPWLLLVVLAVGLVSGAYPAFYLASLQPGNTIRAGRGKKRGLRGILVSFQFAVATLLVIGTLTLRNQMRFMRLKDLGYSPDRLQIMVFPDMKPATVNRCNSWLEALRDNPLFEDVSVSRFTPTFHGASTVILDWEGRLGEEGVYLHMNHVDDHYLGTYKMTLLSGRNFSKQEGSAAIPCLINETAAARFGWTVQEAPGRRIGVNWSVIGVVRDFHFASLREPIGPLVMLPLTDPGPGSRVRNQAAIRLVAGRTEEAKEFLAARFAEYFPNNKLNTHFLEEEFDMVYQSDRRTTRAVGYFTLVSLLVAVLGLVGLALCLAEQRTKEIGIRKVLGASAGGIVLLFSRDFGKWILLANLAAWPAAYLILSRWLRDFAYRTTLSPELFLIPSIGLLFLAWTTVGSLVIKTARINPAQSLKCE